MSISFMSGSASTRQSVKWAISRTCVKEEKESRRRLKEKTRPGLEKGKVICNNEMSEPCVRVIKMENRRGRTRTV